jgi:hypothetical protein
MVTSPGYSVMKLKFHETLQSDQLIVIAISRLDKCVMSLSIL